MDGNPTSVVRIRVSGIFKGVNVMPDRSRFLAICFATCGVMSWAGSVLAQAQPIPEKSAPFPPSQIRPTLLDFVTGMPISYKAQVLATPKLLRPPFAGQSTQTAKGLAAVIKAEELDVKNRVKAVRYLGKQDCLDADSAVAGKPPKPSKATQTLVDVMNTDRSEIVRFEAVQALEEQMVRGCKDPKAKNRGRFENCLGCCHESVLTAVSERAYGVDDYGCPKEPSERVRTAAIHLLEVCCCNSEAAPAGIPVEMQQEGLEPVPSNPVEVPAPPVPAEPSPETKAAIKSLLDSQLAADEGV